MATCRSCGAAIWFGTTEKGRRIPVDAAPGAGGGNIEIRDELFARTVSEPEVVIRSSPVAGGYVSHFATCPDAEKHRRKNGGA